ncbi:Retrovirus-related Pol polyprotein from transposon TNT 1-94 [Gossypium australe]|uniref:Retrovirus-related Pol polyprotein from transposon TNT 1-94 n=1 Tax=Gossypium australe TaxID=47621 RepID=A0A5B6WSR3_9ROSI|nr:Retrovirus-related Pol polyprotein from transposon TNT 1-94 [Gossypium australe]
MINMGCYVSIFEPKKVDDALQDEHWLGAMQEELQEVWTLFCCPQGAMLWAQNGYLKIRVTSMGTLQVTRLA